ncbi:MAG: hypothetical protein M3276_03225 [Actinomycetota bacterium]|nr:hypothetical protein [Actinomycetota bacterium]
MSLIAYQLTRRGQRRPAVSVWRRLIGGGDRTVIEALEWDDDANALASQTAQEAQVRALPAARGYDAGEGRRRWRVLDLGTVKAVPGGGRAAGGLPTAAAVDAVPGPATGSGPWLRATRWSG